MSEKSSQAARISNQFGVKNLKNVRVKIMIDARLPQIPI
jgi:hypothetical protein